MVQGITPNSNVGYTQPVAQGQNYNQQQVTQQMPTKDEFVSQIKKAKRKSLFVGATTIAGSLLALAGGTLMKTKVGRALSVLPIALSTLTFGTVTMLQAKKMGNIEKMVNDMAQ